MLPNKTKTLTEHRVVSTNITNTKWKIKKVRRKQGKAFLTKQTQQVLCPINVRGWRWLVAWGITIRHKFPGEDLGKAQRMLCCYIFTLHYPQICTFGIPAEIHTLWHSQAGRKTQLIKCLISTLELPIHLAPLELPHSWTRKWEETKHGTGQWQEANVEVLKPSHLPWQRGDSSNHLQLRQIVRRWKKYATVSNKHKLIKINKERGLKIGEIFDFLIFNSFYL